MNLSVSQNGTMGPKLSCSWIFFTGGVYKRESLHLLMLSESKKAFIPDKTYHSQNRRNCNRRHDPTSIPFYIHNRRQISLFHLAYARNCKKLSTNHVLSHICTNIWSFTTVECKNKDLPNCGFECKP